MEQATGKIEDRDAWDQHWESYAESAALNPAQDYRRRVLSYLLRRHAPRAAGAPLRLLDIGSGTGDFAKVFIQEQRDAEVLGLEYSQKGVEIAARKVPEAKFIQCDLLQKQSPAAKYRGWANAAVCSEVLEHVDQPHILLANTKPYLAPGALVIVTVPGGPMSYFDRHIGHRQHFSRESLSKMIADAGFVHAGVRCGGFPFFNLYKLIVIARGKSLVQDAASTPRGMSFPARMVMGTFSMLFHLNVLWTPWGWQMIAWARATK